MTESEKRLRVIAEDYKAVIEEAKQMGCNKIMALYNIPIENMELIVLALEKQIPRKPIRIGKDTCPKCGTYNETWVKRRNTLPNDIVYCWHCGQPVEITRE